MAPSTVNLRGEGGSVWEFALPLGKVYAEQVRKGRLRAADEESAEALAGSGIWAEAEAEEPGQEPEAPEWPGTHAELDALAEQLGVEYPAPAEGQKRLKVVEKIAALEAAEHAPPGEG